jgi:hypothetical protein
MIAVSRLSLSDGTKARLAAWVNNHDDQFWLRSGNEAEPSTEWKRAFEREAVSLWQQIQHGLGPHGRTRLGPSTEAALAPELLSSAPAYHNTARAQRDCP